MRKISVLIVALLFCCTTITLLYAEDEATVRGLITERSADTLTLRTESGSQVVTLTDSTKVESPKGLGLRKEQMSWTSLIPGLKVTVKGVSTGGKFQANRITFSKDDLQTASMIQAGLTPTEQKVEENKQNIATNQESISVNQANISANKAQISANEKEVSDRFSQLSDFDVKDKDTVYFSTGKSAISEKEKADLKALASKATGLSGYIIEVKGFADSTGNAATNQTLSKDRAYAVVNYLMQECNVPPRHIVSPGAMGISNPVASNETAQGRSENRRVEVTLMVNKGITAAGN
jgi:outer membrane protein OmpA-like peptidoglycan-associated protein